VFGLAGLVLAAYAVRRRYPALGAVLGVLAVAAFGVLVVASGFLAIVLLAGQRHGRTNSGGGERGAARHNRRASLLHEFGSPSCLLTRDRDFCATMRNADQRCNSPSPDARPPGILRGANGRQQQTGDESHSLTRFGR
jgi:hypothetical protein